MSFWGKLIRLPLKLIPPDTVMPIFWGALRGKKWIVGSGVHGYWLGTYEYKKLIFFKKLIEPHCVVYDIGANTGFYSLLASAQVGQKGQVLAFEPVPQNLKFLKNNLKNNKVKNVTVYPYGISDREGIVFFNTGTDRATGHLASSGNLKVKTVSVDFLVNQKKRPIPDYLKIDVEGAEKLVLLGAKKLCKNTIPLFF